MHHNLMHVGDYSGIELSDNAGGDFYNNTILGSGSTAGVHVHDFVLEYQDLVIENNIMVRFPEMKYQEHKAKIILVISIFSKKR